MKNLIRCDHPKNSTLSIGGNSYRSLKGTRKSRTPKNFRTYGKVKHATWNWCFVCGALGSLDNKDKLAWLVPNYYIDKTL